MAGFTKGTLSFFLSESDIKKKDQKEGEKLGTQSDDLYKQDIFPWSNGDMFFKNMFQSTSLKLSNYKSWQI